MNKEKVLVLLASHNGEKFIEEQIMSILNQKDVDVSILISDDNSTDNTLNIIKNINSPKISVVNGVFGSAQKNFYNLIDIAEGYKYYALSDQDDYWNDDKLISAINRIKDYDDDYALHYGVSQPADKYLNPQFTRYKHHESIALENALVVSNTQGATMVLNDKLLKMLKGKRTSTNIMHDGWIHKTCLVLGGKVVFDPIPHMIYRIHENNVFAERNTFFQKVFKNLKYIFGKSNYYLVTTLIDEWIEFYGDSLSEHTLECFNILKDRTFKSRRKLLFSKRFTSQYKISLAKFRVLALRNKL